MAGRNAQGPVAAVITDARHSTSLSTDQRTQRYLVSMVIRVACFFAAVAAPLPWNLLFLLGAAVIPGVAVLLGNTKDNHREKVAVDDPVPVPALALTDGWVVRGSVDEETV